MKQYLALCQRIVDEGHWVENKRTGIRCLTVVNADLEYDVAPKHGSIWEDLLCPTRFFFINSIIVSKLYDLSKQTVWYQST